MDSCLYSRSYAYQKHAQSKRFSVLYVFNDIYPNETIVYWPAPPPVCTFAEHLRLVAMTGMSGSWAVRAMVVTNHHGPACILYPLYGAELRQPYNFAYYAHATQFGGIILRNLQLLGGVR